MRIFSFFVNIEERGKKMNDDKEELVAWIKERMRQKGGGSPGSFYQVLKEDPYLLKDLFQTFSGLHIIDAILDENAKDADYIGVWVKRKGDSLPTYAEIYTSDVIKNETNQSENDYLYS
jgi:hypothetical protein